MKKSELLFSVLCVVCLFVVNATTAVAADLNPTKYFNFYGSAEFSMFPPHNEPDLNLRGFSPDWNGGGKGYANFGPAYARYAVEADINIELKKFNKVFVFAKPYLALCDTIPQQHYGWDPSPKAFRKWIGIGVHLTKNLDLLIQSHEWIMMGNAKNAAISDGPFGRWQGVTLRYKFDTRE